MLFAIPMKRVLPQRIRKDLAIFASNAYFDYRLKRRAVMLEKTNDCLERYRAGPLAGIAWDLKG